MKILYFATNEGRTEAIKYRDEQRMKGNKVSIINGLAKKGFEDSCQKVVLSCENDSVESWAKKNLIDIEYTFDKKEVVVEEVVEDEFDSIIAEQVAKSPDPEVFKVPHVSEIEAGTYKAPDGRLHEKKKGPKLKSSFETAIMKYGFDKFEKID
jgi:hypothetical protein